MKLKLFLISLALTVTCQSANAFPAKCPSIASVKSFSTSPKLVIEYGMIGRSHYWMGSMHQEKFDTNDYWNLDTTELEGDNEAEARASLIMRMKHITSVNRYDDMPNRGETECAYIDDKNSLIVWVTNK